MRPASGIAHVAPSIDDNNRYLKIAPMSDRVRIAYTVFFGSHPGQVVRRSLDKDQDGRISDAEARVVGQTIADQLASDLDARLDGVQLPIRWTTVDVGLGSPETAAGAFSVDLLAWLCVPHRGRDHTLLVHDRFSVPSAGETEVRVEPTAGVSIGHAHVGPATAADGVFRFAGPAGQLSDDGIELTYLVAGDAPFPNDGACARDDAPAPPRARWPWMVALLLLLAVASALFIVTPKPSRSS